VRPGEHRVGNISDNDVRQRPVARHHLCFNVAALPNVKRVASRDKLMALNVIYGLIDDVKEGRKLLAPES